MLAYYVLLSHVSLCYPVPFYCCRLHSIQNRPGIRASLAEKFVEIFNWYEADLEEVQKIYESHKVSTAGMVVWLALSGSCIILVSQRSA